MSDLNEVLAARKLVHGEFRDHARITQNLKAMVHAEHGFMRCGAIQREAIEMILHKIGRVLAGDPEYKDHWIDIAGYAKLVADRVP